MALAHMITNSRKEHAYAFFFESLIKATHGKWKPKLVMADFEGGIHLAVKSAFHGKTKSRKCWFHMRKAVNEHLKKKVNIKKGK